MNPKTALAPLALIPFFAKHTVHREELAHCVSDLLDREDLLSSDLEHFLQWAPEVPYDPREGANRLRELLRNTQLFTEDTDKFLSNFSDRELRYPSEQVKALLFDYFQRHDLLSPEVNDLLKSATERDNWHPREYEEYRQEVIDCAIKEASEVAKQTAESSLQRVALEYQQLADTQVSRMEASLKDLRRETAMTLREHSEGLRITSGEIQSHLWLTSCGVDYSVVRATRYIPVRIYVTDPVPNHSNLEALMEAIQRLASSLDFEVANEFPPEKGSWFKRFILKTKTLLTHKEVTDRIGMAEDALEATYLDKPKAEANKLQAEAASSVINALKETLHACIQVGSLLVVKSHNANGESATIARTLTREELKRLEENQFMLERPGEILNWLGATPSIETKKAENE